MWQYNYSDELYHFGVKGMKWGHRKAHSTSSLGRAKAAYKAEKKRIDAAYTKAGAKYDRDTKGGKISNKKADRELDAAADKWAADRKTAKQTYKNTKSEIKSKRRAEKKQFKNDVKTYKKSVGILDIEAGKDGNLLMTTRTSTLYNSLTAKKGKAYADKVVNTYEKQQRRETVAMLVGGAAVMAGSVYVDSILSKY